MVDEHGHADRAAWIRTRWCYVVQPEQWDACRCDRMGNTWAEITGNCPEHGGLIPLDAVSRETADDATAVFPAAATPGHPALSRIPLPVAPDRDGS